MITYDVSERILRGDTFWRRFSGYCLSTDTKPTEHILNGSSLIEMDTGKVYFFDEANGQWREFGG